MKAYRVRPEFINQILLNRLPAYLRVVVISLVIAIPYLYYFHPRTEPYDNWSDFFKSTSTQVAGAFYVVAVLIGLLWGIYIGRKSLQTLVVTVHDDHVAWNTLKDPTKQIYFTDLNMIKDAAGITLSSKANRKVMLKVPKQIDDFAELEDSLIRTIQ